MKYLPALDGVRGISILLVVLFHFYLVDIGWIGVEIFFVLSGFLITKILSKGKDWPLGFYLKRFYWRRFLRIFPIYYAFLFALVLIYLLTGHPSELFDILPYLVTYTTNIVIMFLGRAEHVVFHYLWSLSLEEQFYLIWPLVVFFLPRKALLGLCIGIVVLSPVIRWGMGEYLSQLRGTTELVGGMVYYLPIGQFDTFATGGLLALLPWQKAIKRPQLVFGLTFGLFLLAGLINLSFFQVGDHGYSPQNLGYPVASMARGQHIWGYTLINFMAAGLIMVGAYPVREAGGMVRKVLEMRWLMNIGKVSYGMYILHSPMQMVMDHFIPVPENYLLRVLQFFPFMALVWLASWLSFRYFESWFLKQKNRKFNEIPSPQPAGHS